MTCSFRRTAACTLRIHGISLVARCRLPTTFVLVRTVESCIGTVALDRRDTVAMMMLTKDPVSGFLVLWFWQKAKRTLQGVISRPTVTLS